MDGGVELIWWLPWWWDATKGLTYRRSYQCQHRDWYLITCCSIALFKAWEHVIEPCCKWFGASTKIQISECHDYTIVAVGTHVQYKVNHLAEKWVKSWLEMMYLHLVPSGICNDNHSPALRPMTWVRLGCLWWPKRMAKRAQYNNPWLHHGSMKCDHGAANKFSKLLNREYNMHHRSHSW